MNNHSIAQNDPFYKLIEKQTEEFREYIRVSLDLQISYKDYLVQQNGRKFCNSTDNSIDFKKVCERYEEKIDNQSKLIDSLKTRIEELETDSIIKTQNIKKLQQEFIDFKKRDTKRTTSSTSSKVESNEDEDEDEILKNVKTESIDTIIFEDEQEMSKRLKSYQKAVIIAERKNLARNERIHALEALLKEAQDKLVSQNERSEEQLQKVRERLENTRSQKYSSFSGLTFGSIAKPLRGGLSVNKQ
ncbi:1802_t:CDS:2 [Funneliformis geosporum]|uniref:10116_t:CDS:1 n=1 Tax=Funneliformis geosporum TaxID=1117311 RepID=A0A9W4WWU9_9GLOM|nr:1802_t:CDS:2 [Funneliformis geosporum]CAI2191634.1 10116_t:CDS:2 [Funneliformis geosporum]